MPLIEVENLEKTYFDGEVETPAVCGVSFKVEKGDFVAVMGASGSGKSTLLHILGFLDKHTGGIYKFRDRDINNYSEEEIVKLRNSELGFVFQTFNLMPRLSVLENVKLPFLYSDVKPKLWNQKAKEAIESVGMGHRMNHLASKLSGGEKQRAAIARALVNNPEIIFADEPTGNLDSTSGEIIMEIIEELNVKFGHTIMLITHETYTANYAGRILELHDGKLIKNEIVKNRHKVKDGKFIK